MAQRRFPFRQLTNCGKPTGAGTAIMYGDTVYFDNNDQLWKNAEATSVQPFGICGTLEPLTQIRDELSNELKDYTRGISDDADCLSVVVEGRIEKLADGVIPPMSRVTIPANHPKTHVQVWDEIDGNAVFGQYVINITRHTMANKQLPPTVDNDKIKVDIPVYAKFVKT